MTDFPAVIYLKASCSNAGEDIFENHDHQCESNDMLKKPSDNKLITESKKRTESFKALLEGLNKVIIEKMTKIEESLETLSQHSEKLEGQIDELSLLVDSNSFRNNINKSTEGNIKQHQIVPFYSKITPIILNTKDDFPNGSWLGFENNPEMRVRCNIKPRELNLINKKCTSPIKMALVLLDHLFDKDTQASSNISGLGKHKKKQLNPLFIYGIRCHLMYHFDITDDDWTKIKIHMDSKCRSVFRKKVKEMSLNQNVHKLKK